MSPQKETARLPVQQLVILSICRFAEPIALTSVFPYLPEMIESFGVGTNDVARWAGITSAVFSLAQACTGILWGRAADRLGRKPALLAGLIGVMITILAFGLSRTLAWAVIARSVSGAVSGNVGVIRTTVAELVPQKELQPRAFSVMPLVWGVGSIAGPILGGLLARPAQLYPSVFDQTHLFGTFPYLLPNVVASIFFIIGLVTGFLFLEESLASHKHQPDFGRRLGGPIIGLFKTRKMSRKQGDEEESANLLKPTRTSSKSSIQSDTGSFTRKTPIRETPATYREVFTRQSSISLLAYALLALHSIAYDQLIPIFMHHPRQTHTSSTSSTSYIPTLKFSNGFGLNHGRIGLLFTIYAILCTFIQFVIYPPAANRFGVLPCFKFISIIFPLAYLLTPFTALFEDPVWRQASLCAVMMLKGFAGMFAFPCAIILITNSASSYRILGTLNGVSTSISALGRAAGPAIGGATFTWGVKVGYIVLPWWTLAAFAAVGAVPLWWLEEGEGFRAAQENDDKEESSIPAINEPPTGDDPNPAALPAAQETPENTVQEAEGPLSASLLSETSDPNH